MQFALEKSRINASTPLSSQSQMSNSAVSKGKPYAVCVAREQYTCCSSSCAVKELAEGGGYEQSSRCCKSYPTTSRKVPLPSQRGGRLEWRLRGAEEAACSKVLLTVAEVPQKVFVNYLYVYRGCVLFRHGDSGNPKALKTITME